MSSSGKRINYTLRPSKQVERKLIIELLHRLASEGYTIPSYTYLGMGSIYYYDFILFHRYLYIKKMICAESSTAIKRRMKFNRPYKFIRLLIEPISQVIPKLSRNVKYMAWLDYDKMISSTAVNDIVSLCSLLKSGSVFIISVPTRSPLEGLSVEEAAKEKQELESSYEADFGNYLPADFGLKNYFEPALFQSLNLWIINAAISRSLNGSGNEFLQLMNFKYSDGLKMTTLGGVIDSPEKIASLKRSKSLMKCPYVSTRLDKSIGISVPPLTLREKIWLDKNLRDGLKQSDLQFELDREFLDNYKLYYSQYPEYFESIL